ncbi:putative Transmembrane protein [Quillaja saponaria]|uniref:Transmembrane protein n=1 Tax=Quillaja saponaria TaxID=32244 RepID=A0AAD7KP45_QUISA|nr:putative Transmembrane protein [Quillaja saponaria]
MEIPIINRIANFEVGLNSLQNPSFLSQTATSSMARIESVSVAYTFCKWSAVILALIATLGGIINRVKLLIIKFRRENHSLPSFPLFSELDDDDFSSDDDDEVTFSSSSSVSSEYEEEEEDEQAATASSSVNWRQIDEDFSVRGSGHYFDDQWQNSNIRLRRRRSIGDFLSLSEFVNGKSVVKLWDSIGFRLGLDLADDSESYGGVVSAYDDKKENRKLIPAVSSSSKSVIVTAGATGAGNLALKIWDTRLKCSIPAIIAEWRPHLGKIVGIGSGGVEKVYFRDDASDGVTVGDIRNASSPLGNVTESDMDTWWDADAVIVSDESS